MNTLYLQTFSDFQREKEQEEKEQDISAVILETLNNISEPMGCFFRIYRGFLITDKKKDQKA